MCGICGYIAQNNPSPPLLEKMVATLRQRGPDGDGYFQSQTQHDQIGLGYTRLAIVGLDSGNQPLYSRDRQKILVCNGEIYNYQELRRRFQKKGYTFASDSDCEVLLALYEEQGLALFEQINGMFSFALWDQSKERLLLARDRLGKKPLYYSLRPDLLLFGSEIKALLAGGVKPQLNATILDAFLTTQVMPSGQSIFQNILQLKPGHYATYEQGKLNVVPYFSLKKSVSISNAPLRTLKETLESAVYLRLQTDVPCGVFLSGGFDSSLVLALMRQTIQEPIPTFSIGFSDSKYDESPFARVVARHFQTQHHEQTLFPNSLEILEKLVEIFDEPFGDSSAVPCYYLSALAKKTVKVVLTGDGGDELFFGYPRYQAVKLARAIHPFLFPFRGLIEHFPVPSDPKSRPFRLKKLLSHSHLSLAERYLLWNTPFSPVDKLALYTNEFRREMIPWKPADFLDPESLQVADFAFYDQQNYLPNDILVKVDRTSMANGIECRSPFLDYRVVLLANQLSESQKLRGLQGKYILKKMFASMLPEIVLRRKKMGFGVPLALWLRKESHEFCRQNLLSQDFLQRNWFRPETLLKWLEEHRLGKANHAERLWLLLNIALWARKYL
ncbi:MAG: asparagine synthase (glutamine-hydrolyzing) [Planctomycetota bacterium]